jgi:thioredoxin 1
MEHEAAQEYEPQEPTREEIERIPGPVLLNFGTNWCSYCRALQPPLTALLAGHPEVRHLKIEDGKGKPLGRSFHVKLWPTLVFLRDGKILKQLSRPDLKDIRESLEAITRPSN